MEARDGTSRDRDAEADRRSGPSGTRRRRRRVRLFLAAVALCLAGWYGWYAYYAHTPEYRIARLVAEYRALLRDDPPRPLEKLLIQIGLQKPHEPRSAVDIGRDLRALGPQGIAAGVEAMLETPPAARSSEPTFSSVGFDVSRWAGYLIAKWCGNALVGGLGPEATGPLTAVLKDRAGREPSERESAVQGLGVLAPQSDDAVLALVAAAVPRLVGMLERPVRPLSPLGRASVLLAIARTGTAAKAAVPAALAALEDEDPLVRSAALYALTEIAPMDPPACVPALAGVLGDVDWYSDCRIVECFGDIGPPAAAAVGSLIRVLWVSRWEELRYRAARALGRIGPVAGDAVPTLLETLHDKDWYLRAHSAVALSRIDPARPEVVAALVAAALSDEHPHCRQTAAEALAGAPAAAGPAVAAFSKVLGERDAIRRTRAIEALSALARAGGEASQAAKAALTAALSDDDPQVRDQARRALLAAR